MEITGEIYQVGGARLTSPEDAAIYLINFRGHAALVDSGCGGSTERLLANIRSHGVEPRQIEFIFLTHCHFDHTGGAAELRELLSCRIVAHEKDAGFLEEGDDEVTAASWYGTSLEPFSPDIILSGPRSEIELGSRLIHAVHIPGHSPGSVAYYTRSEGLRVLFGQDVHGPIHRSLLSDREQYLASLELLLTLEADILCEGHYGIIRGKKETADFIRRFLLEKKQEGK